MGKRKSGFYRMAVAKREESGEAASVDVAEIKQRLIEEMRRRPGELHLLLQGSKVVLRAAALEHRLSLKDPKAVAESLAAVYAHLDEQIGLNSGP